MEWIISYAKCFETQNERLRTPPISDHMISRDHMISPKSRDITEITWSYLEMIFLLFWVQKKFKISF